MKRKLIAILVAGTFLISGCGASGSGEGTRLQMHLLFPKQTAHLKQILKTTKHWTLLLLIQ